MISNPCAAPLQHQVSTATASLVHVGKLTKVHRGGLGGSTAYTWLQLTSIAEFILFEDRVLLPGTMGENQISFLELEWFLLV